MLTALAGAEPVVGVSGAAVQRLQFFVSESTWDAEAVNARRLELLAAEAATAAHAGGVLVVDDSGDRKDGHATAHVARQYLGSVGKTDNGIVAVPTLWADERVYYPLHVVPYTPAGRLPGGSHDPEFVTKPEIAVDLVARAVAAGVRFAVVVADCFYGPSETVTLVGALERAGLPYVLALKPHMKTWARAEEAHSPVEAAEDLGWRSRRRPGGWRPVTRRFRDGRTETWWAGDARLATSRSRPTASRIRRYGPTGGSPNGRPPGSARRSRCGPPTTSPLRPAVFTAVMWSFRCGVRERDGDGARHGPRDNTHGALLARGPDVPRRATHSGAFPSEVDHAVHDRDRPANSFTPSPSSDAHRTGRYRYWPDASLSVLDTRTDTTLARLMTMPFSPL